jgi:hypothetical protein
MAQASSLDAFAWSGMHPNRVLADLIDRNQRLRHPDLVEPVVRP